MRARRPAFRLARLESGRLQTGLRVAMLMTALALLLHGLAAGNALPALGGAVVAALLLALAESAPISWTREGPLTLTLPAGLALALWLGPVAAALGALLACLLPARRGEKPASRRGELSARGAPLALAAFACGAAALLSARALHLRLGTASSLAALESGAPLSALAAALLGALAFAAASLLFGAGAHLDSVRALWRAPRARSHLGSLALITALGMLPIVLLAPFAAKWGLAVALPATALLLVFGQWARMALEVSSLRRQLAAAEAMGRASVADPATDRDASLLLMRFLTLARSLVSAERALVWTMDQETRELTPAAALPDQGLYAGQRALLGEGLIGHAAARLRPRLIADAGRDPRRGEREVAFGSWLLYPIAVHDRLLGVAQWVRPVSHPFTPEDIARLASLVPQAAVALENLRIRETMHNLAATDGLTGLWNHRRMHDLLRDEMRRASRYLRPLSALMLDVDSFKGFNDTYGHPQGDQLLRAIASILHA
ncbi:MAG TPA: sensor domain-containing diguanylate cyclase, partial [Chthonomonadaceae bacterium]|nr:sensor domain-containing diguanylate cyclase [Chthonomonadaceae bacterium]